MKLHWSPRSPFVRKVMIFARETGLAESIELERSVVAMRKPNAAVMRDNPLGKLPTLVLDDGQALFDSAVICEYLDSLHAGAPLFPPTGQARWEALRWQALGDGLLDLLVLWRNAREWETAKVPRDLTNAFDLKTRTALALLEVEAPALQAAAFGIGHISIICALGYLDYRFAGFDWRPGHARIAAWFAAQSQRPSVRLTVPADD
jgi:glutathione S-transferase